jgi:hypothetical protein
VASRPPGIDQADVVAETPAELDGHVADLKQAATAAPYFAEGWSIRLVHLDRVVAFQPTVFTDSAQDRVEGVEANDLAAIAAVTLPIAPPSDLAPGMNEPQKTWTLVSANPNLKVIGHFAGPIQGTPVGSVGLGWIVTITSSFLQVARFQGRFLLRDGYHRAFGLLKGGITRVPAFVRDFTTFAELGVPVGMLEQEAYLGERPPRLVDYLDDEVAETVELPAVQKMVAIQGLEFVFTG